MKLFKSKKVKRNVSPNDQRVFEDYMILKRRVCMDSLNFKTLKPGEKIYAAIVTSYQRTQSYKNAQEAKLMKMNSEKYDMMKDGITYTSEFLKSRYNDSDPKEIQLILRPDMVFLIPLFTNYFPEWDIEVNHALQSVAQLTPMPSIVRFTRKVLA